MVGGMGGGILVGFSSVFKKVKMFVGTVTEHSDERGGNAGGWGGRNWTEWGSFERWSVVGTNSVTLSKAFWAECKLSVTDGMLGLLVVTEGGVNPGGGGSFEGSGFGWTNSAENSKSVSRNFHGISRLIFFKKKKIYHPICRKLSSCSSSYPKQIQTWHCQSLQMIPWH